MRANEGQQSAMSARLTEWVPRLSLAGFQRPSVWLLGLTILIGSVALALNGADPDLWGHVQYGRDLFRHGFPLTSTYNYTVVGYRWVNHENLSEVALACGLDHLGPTGMMLVKTGLGWLVLGLIIRHGWRQKAGYFSICLVVLLTAVNLAYFWSFRPQLLTGVCYTLMIAVLTDRFAQWSNYCESRWIWLQGWNRTTKVPGYGDPQARGELCSNLMQTLTASDLRKLWWLIPIMIVWTNSHGGFVAGLCILFVYFGCRILELLADVGWSGAPLLIRLAILPIMIVVATLVNPYGVGLYQWLLYSLGKPRPEIVEWQPPGWAELNLLPFYLLLIMIGSSFLLSRRKPDGTHIIILLLIFWQTCLHLRHLLFLAIAFAFWGLPHVDGLCRRFRVETMLNDFFLAIGQRRWGRIGSIIVLACLFVLTVGQLYSRMSELRVDRRLFPVAAVEYLAEQQVKGRMVVTFNWAQYVISALGAETERDGVLVSFDGRFRTCYPQEIVDMNLDFMLGDQVKRFRSSQSPPFDPQRVLSYGHPDLVLVDRGQPHPIAIMERVNADWVLLYQDQQAQVWGRRSIYDNPADARYWAMEKRKITNEPQQGFVAWPALPRSRSDGGVRRQSREIPARLDHLQSSQLAAAPTAHSPSENGKPRTGN